MLNLGIPFFVVFLSLGMNLDDNDLRRILIFYIISVTVMGLALVLYYGNGFSIIVTYNIPAKNQRGPMISYAILILFMSVFDKKNISLRFLNKYISLTLLFLNFLVILTLRNRASLLAIFVCAFFIILSKFNYKNTMKKWFLIFFVVTIFIMVSAFGLLDGLYSFIWDSITLNYDVTDIESLSAGRMDTYIEAIQYSFKNPVAGEIISNISFPNTPHNYILNNWVSFGILLSTPLNIFYFYLWYFAIKGIITDHKNSLSVWLLLFSLIVSLFEYTYPYGPGVSQLFMWFLLGQYLSKNKVQEKLQL